MKTTHYSACFTLIANFTCVSLRDWNACANSISFLLTLWSRMTCANRYVTLTDAIRPNSLVLKNLIPQVVEAYIDGRLIQVCDETAVNPLDNPESIQEEMSQFPQMVRFEYEKNGGCLLSRMESCLNEYEVRLERMILCIELYSTQY